MKLKNNLKSSTVTEINSQYHKTTISAASAMMHIADEFNQTTFIQNSNFFGFEKLFCVGESNQYTRIKNNSIDNSNVKFVKTETSFVSLAREHNYIIIAIENNANHTSTDNFFEFVDSIDIETFRTPMFIFGDEHRGLSDYMLYNSDHILSIPPKGFIKSLNVGTTSGIVFAYYSQLFV